jgi:hypothetical protein
LVAGKFAGHIASIHSRGEAHALLRLRLEHRRLDQLFEIARGEQIRLLQVVVVRVLAPFLGRETPVAGLGGNQRFGLARSEAAPQPRLLVEIASLQRRIAPRKARGRGRRAGHDPHPALRDLVAGAGD